MRGVYGLFFVVLVSLAGNTFANDLWRQKAENPKFIHRTIKKLTDVIVHDIYSPPVASRIYAYTAVAGYEAAISNNKNYVSLAGQLHGLSKIALPPTGKDYSSSLSSVHAMLLVGESLIISEKKLKEFHKIILAEFKKLSIPESVFKNSLIFGELVANHILSWSAKDNYKETRSFPKYDIGEEDETWKPTPPLYMRAIEPHWGELRTFIIDSAKQFKPLPPTKFSRDKQSKFYQEAKRVHEAGLKLSPGQKAIASFWDCNPFKMNIKGHVMYATKKISPGGHWINITGLACQKVGANFLRSAEAYAWVALTLADGFISCWDEKYRSNVIRPETYINEHVDGNWRPFLQTPPFPEYTSGHSVISAASALVLTKLFGENFYFNDHTEVVFGLPVRPFKSFKAAAEEAALSRFYGGIHYMPAITNGLEEGNQVGSFILKKLNTRK